MGENGRKSDPESSAVRPASPTGGAESPGDQQALAALQRRLARPQPKPFDAPAPAVPEYPLGSGSATGFVGTLAKGAGDSRAGPDDSLAGAKAPDDSRAGEAVTDGDASEATKVGSELIQMAREISAPRPASPIAHLTPKPVARKRSGGLSGFMTLLGVALLLIGGWAVGALIYMRTFTPMSPRDVTYPLVTWSIDLHTGGAYSQASVVMAWSMLACVPVGLLLLFAGMRYRAAARRARP